MADWDENPYAKTFQVSAEFAGRELPAVATDRVTMHFAADIDRELSAWVAQGYLLLGRSEMGVRNDYVGISFEARDHAALVGADVVLLESTSTLKRAIRPGSDGHIDIALVRAMPAKSVHRKGWTVVRAAFLIAPERSAVSPPS